MRSLTWVFVLIGVVWLTNCNPSSGSSCGTTKDPKVSVSISNGSTATATAAITKSAVNVINSTNVAPNLVGFTVNGFMAYGVDVDPVSDNGQHAVGYERFGMSPTGIPERNVSYYDLTYNKAIKKENGARFDYLTYFEQGNSEDLSYLAPSDPLGNEYNKIKYGVDSYNYFDHSEYFDFDYIVVKYNIENFVFKSATEDKYSVSSKVDVFANDTTYSLSGITEYLTASGSSFDFLANSVTINPYIAALYNVKSSDNIGDLFLNDSSHTFANEAHSETIFVFTPYVTQVTPVRLLSWRDADDTFLPSGYEYYCATNFNDPYVGTCRIFFKCTDTTDAIIPNADPSLSFRDRVWKALAAFNPSTGSATDCYQFGNITIVFIPMSSIQSSNEGIRLSAKEGASDTVVTSDATFKEYSGNVNLVFSYSLNKVVSWVQNNTSTHSSGGSRTHNYIGLQNTKDANGNDTGRFMDMRITPVQQ